MKDDVPEDVKTRRLNEIIALQNKLSGVSKKSEIGKTLEVLVEGRAKKSITRKDEGHNHLPASAKQDTNVTMMGRTSGNKVVVFQASGIKPGDYVNVEITSATSATLIGTIV
jgi:tRNA-2-methylthio-N6-dimethylallyladenosine synthase